MALQLYQHNSDNHDIVKFLYMLDGSHEFVNAHTTSYRKKFMSQDGPEVETEILCAFVNQFTFVEYKTVSIVYCAVGMLV